MGIIEYIINYFLQNAFTIFIKIYHIYFLLLISLLLILYILELIFHISNLILLLRSGSLFSIKFFPTLNLLVSLKFMNGFLSLKFWLKNGVRKSQETIGLFIFLWSRIECLYCMMRFGSDLLVIACKLLNEKVESYFLYKFLVLLPMLSRVFFN